MMTSFRYTVLPPYVEEIKAVKSEAEIRGLKAAYLRDGVAYVRWLAWLEHKLQQGYGINEYEAAWRLTEYRRKQKNYMGLAYENISASGPNAGESPACVMRAQSNLQGSFSCLALPHYVPHKATARDIDRDTPYLK